MKIFGGAKAVTEAKKIAKKGKNAIVDNSKVRLD